MTCHLYFPTVAYIEISVANSSFFAKATWTNAKFGGVKDIPDLAEYDWHLQVGGSHVVLFGC